ncbi:MAG: hypothetical protein ACP5MZ_00370 [Candidatus Micrarchaeia archaeon]
MTGKSSRSKRVIEGKKSIQGSKANKRSNGKKGITTWPLYVLFLVLIALYVAEQGRQLSIIFGTLAAFVIIAIIAVEFLYSVKDEGLKRNLIEAAIAIVIVVLIWFALRFFLGTSDPIDVVPSCSMLPTLQRGDLIMLQGVSLGSVNAPVINVTQNEFNSMERNFNSENLVCMAYVNSSSGTQVSQIVHSGWSVGLFRFNEGRYYQVPSSYQNSNLVRYFCGSRPIEFSNGTVENEAYTIGIDVLGHSVYGDSNNTIIVYRTLPSDYFYMLGDEYVVHRVYAVLNVSGSYYALTKGDNNPGLDMQYGNYPINQSHVSGKVIASVPYLGYIKLMFSGDIAQPAGCNSVVQH